MDSPGEVRELLEEAAVFERAGDLTGAVARAEAALRRAQDEEARDEARVELERFRSSEHAWRAEVEGRQAASLTRERAEAGSSKLGELADVP